MERSLLGVRPQPSSLCALLPVLALLGTQACDAGNEVPRNQELRGRVLSGPAVGFPDDVLGKPSWVIPGNPSWVPGRPPSTPPVPQPRCRPTFNCNTVGANCGILIDDCGVPQPCGTCSSPQTCSGSGLPNVCGCPPTTSQCDPGQIRNPLTCVCECAESGCLLLGTWVDANQGFAFCSNGTLRVTDPSLHEVWCEGTYLAGESSPDATFSVNCSPSSPGGAHTSTGVCALSGVIMSCAYDANGGTYTFQGGKSSVDACAN